MTITTPGSTNIESIDYEPQAQLLTVCFRNGHCYEYSGVPAEVWHDFRNASSAGRYFAANIKGRYPTTKVG